MMRNVIIAVFFLLLSAGCGSSNGSSGTGSASKDLNAAPDCASGAEVVRGGSVPISVDQCEKDCTGFFHPLSGSAPDSFAFLCDSVQGGVTVPNLPSGDYAVTCGAKDGATISLCKIHLSPVTASQGATGNTGPAGPPSPPTPECAADSDCIAGKKCQGGSCVEVVAPPSPPPFVCHADGDCPSGQVCKPDGSCAVPPPPLPATAKFVVTGPDATGKVVSPTARFNAIRLNYKIENADQAYIYGPFNRTVADSDCVLTGTRYLVTTDVGNDVTTVMPNWATEYKKFAEGEKCDTSTDNCKNYAPTAGEGRICKIDLTAAGLAGVFYTDLLVPQGKFILAAHGKDGVWTFDEKDFDIPAPSVSNIKVGLTSEREPKATLSFDYLNASAIAVTGCTTAEPPAPPLPLDGQGSYLRNACAFTPSSPPQFTIAATGAGGSDTKTYKLVCGGIQAKLQEGGYYTTERGTTPQDLDLSGYISMVGRFSRSCWVEEKAGSVFHKVSGSDVTIPGAKKMTFYPSSNPFGFWGTVSFDLTDPKVDVKAGEAISGSVLMTRNYYSTQWILIIDDYDGSHVTAPQKIDKPFNVRFDVIDGTWWGSCSGTNHHSCKYVGFSGCNSDITWDNECWYEYGSTDYGIRFQARHVKDIRVNCPDGLDHDVFFDANDPRSYDWQYFELKGHQSNTDIECTFTAIGYDGKEAGTLNPSWTCGASESPHGC